MSISEIRSSHADTCPGYVKIGLLECVLFGATFEECLETAVQSIKTADRLVG